MALSVARHPYGERLSLSPAQTQVCEITLIANVVHVKWVAHGFSNGQSIYIKSVVDNYNGFWSITVASADFFNIYRDGVTLNVNNGWVRPVNGTVTVSFGHTHQSAHTPIVYNIKNTKWPVNTDDTIRTISSVTNSNGYCALSISGDIKATGSAAILEFIKITNSGGGGAFPSYDGVYQIIAYTNETTFTISLAYDNTVDLSVTNASIQYYYNNYHLKIQIWGGLNSGHLFQTQKPIEVVATVDIIPDLSNASIFSVHEILKSKISVKNNLLLGTLPNNIDAFANFYIKYAEVYDVGGTTLTQLTPTYTDDSASFIGYAVNSKMPFKNIYSGAMSEYLYIAGITQKFLTLWSQPTIFSGKYFDIGFISDFYQNFIYPTLNTFLNDASGDVAWTTGAAPSVTVGGANVESHRLYAQLTRIKSGITYRVSILLGSSISSNVELFAGFLNGSGTVVESDSSIAGGTIFFFDLVGTVDSVSLFFKATDLGGGGTVTISDYWIYPTNDASAFNELLLKQGGIDILIENYDEGVYRKQLTDPACNASSTTVTLYRKEILTLALPVNWSNFSGPTAFDIKGFSSFTEDVTTVSVSPVIAYTPLTTATGEVVRITLPIVVSGGATFTSGIRVTLVLADGVGVATSNTATQTITADGSYTLEAVLTATGAGARIYLQCIRDGLSAGTATVVITIPETITNQKTGAISETKTINIDCTCADQERYLTWIDPLGPAYWNFTGKKDRGIDIIASGETKKNLFPTWPQSYGEFADSITVQTYRTSKKTERVISQHLTEAQVEAISYIKTSPLVQIINSIYDKRTVIVDTNSFVVLKEIEKLYSIEFNITYTDEIPSQTL